MTNTTNPHSKRKKKYLIVLENKLEVKVVSGKTMDELIDSLLDFIKAETGFKEAKR